MTDHDEYAPRSYAGVPRDGLERWAGMPAHTVESPEANRARLLARARMRDELARRNAQVRERNKDAQEQSIQQPVNPEWPPLPHDVTEHWIFWCGFSTAVLLCLMAAAVWSALHA